MNGGGGGTTRREDRFSGSLKRLFSPPEQSQNSKRPRTGNPSPPRAGISLAGSSTKGLRPLNRPLKTPCLLSEKSTRQSESLTDDSRGVGVDFNDTRNTLMSVQSVCGRQIKRQEEQGKKDSSFTVITELKQTEPKTNSNLHSSLSKDTCTVAARTHEPSAEVAKPAPRKEFGLKEQETTKTLVTDGDENKRTSSDQKQVGGTDMFCFLVCIS